MKVMFLAAIVRSCINNNGEYTFDGKIGIYLIVKHLQAQRNSINHPRDTLEWKHKSLTREMYTENINKVLPDVIAKCPHNQGVRTQTIYRSEHLIRSTFLLAF